MWQTINESQKVERPFLIEMLQFKNILLCRQLNSAIAMLNILYLENSLFSQCSTLACVWFQTLFYFWGLLSYYTYFKYANYALTYCQAWFLLVSTQISKLKSQRLNSETKGEELTL